MVPVCVKLLRLVKKSLILSSSAFARLIVERVSRPSLITVGHCRAQPESAENDRSPARTNIPSAFLSVSFSRPFLNLVDCSAEPRSFSSLAGYQVINNFFDFCSYHLQRQE